jgi:SAM-dependent methyltransferase
MTDRSRATRESYDRLAAAYVEHVAGELAGKPLDRHLLDRFAEEVRGRGATADVGCGPGHVARYLHDRGAEVFGIDFSSEMIRQARALHPGIEFRVGDMRTLDVPDRSLAGILAFYSLIHLEDEEIASTLEGFRRALVPGGAVLVAFHVGEETLHVEDLWGQPVALDFRFFPSRRVVEWMEAAGLAVTERTEREPYPEVEYSSRRGYLFARTRPA